MSSPTLTGDDPTMFSPSERTPRNGHFTISQALILIALTVVLTTVAGYLAGKYYFWTNQDVQRINKQMEYLEQQVQAKPKDMKMRTALGYTYYLKGKNDKAIGEFNKVIEQDSKYYDAYYNLGLVYLDEEKLDDALEMFQKTVDLAPRDYKGYLQKGVVYRQLKMFKEAVESLEMANKMLPGSATIIYEIGRVAEDKGDTKGAITIYKEALGYDPLFKEAAEALKRVDKK